MDYDYLFIYNDLRLGGIQTQLLGVAKELRKKEKKVAILLHEEVYDNELYQQLRAISDVFFWPAFRPNSLPKFLFCGKYLLPSLIYFRVDKIRKEIGSAKHVVGLSSIALFHCMILSDKGVFTNAKISTIAYHSLEFHIEKSDSFFIGKLLNFIKNNSDGIKFIATSQDTKEKIGNLLSGKNRDIDLIRCGIPVEGSFKPKLKNKPLRVLFIGRLVNFKSYCLKFLQVVKALNSDPENPQLTYRIVGSGPLLDDIKSEILRLKIGDWVQLMPEQPYSSIGRLIDDSDCFFGSGTVLIEAAARSCPAIVGIESNPQVTTYGFLSDIDGVSIHEPNLKYVVRPIYNVVNSLVEMSNLQYNKLRKENFRKAEEFSWPTVVDSLEVALEERRVNSKIYRCNRRDLANVYVALFFSLTIKIFNPNYKISKSYQVSE